MLECRYFEVIIALHKDFTIYKYVYALGGSLPSLRFGENQPAVTAGCVTNCSCVSYQHTATFILTLHLHINPPHIICGSGSYLILYIHIHVAISYTGKYHTNIIPF